MIKLITSAIGNYYSINDDTSKRMASFDPAALTTTAARIENNLKTNTAIKIDCNDLAERLTGLLWKE